MKEYIGHCSKYQLEEMYKRFYNGPECIQNASIFAEKVATYNKPVSPAQVQGYFMVHKMSDQQLVIDSIEDIWNDGPVR